MFTQRHTEEHSLVTACEQKQTSTGINAAYSSINYTCYKVPHLLTPQDQYHQHLITCHIPLTNLSVTNYGSKHCIINNLH